MALHYVPRTLTSWQSFSPVQGAEVSDIDRQTEPESPCHSQNLQPDSGDRDKHKGI